MTKNALLKRGPKNSGMGRPRPPPYSGNARKKTFFFPLRPSLILYVIFCNYRCPLQSAIRPLFKSVHWYRKFNLDISLNTKQECPSKRARACRVKLRDYQFVWSAPSGSNWMIIRFVLSKVNNGRNKRIYASGLRPFEPFDDFAPTLSYQIDKVCSKSIRSTCFLLWSWN